MEKRLTDAEIAIRKLEQDVAALVAGSAEWHRIVDNQFLILNSKLDPITNLVAEYRGGAKVVRTLFSVMLVAVGAIIKGYWTKLVTFLGN